MKTKKIELYPQQYNFVCSEDMLSAFVGGIGSGKSFAGCVKTLKKAMQSKTVGMVTAPTYTMLRDATMRSFFDLAESAVLDFKKGEMTAILAPFGSEILFRSAENPDRLRGPNLHWWFGDEAAMYRPQVWDVMIGRLRAGGLMGSAWLASTPKGHNWLYRISKEISLFRAKTKDNPYNAPEFYTTLARNYTGNFAAQELDGEFTKMEGLVYNTFDYPTHVKRADRSQYKSFALTMDEGYTNPAVILVVGYDSDNRKHIFREFYETGKLQSEIVNTAVAWGREFDVDLVAVDEAAAGLIADLVDAGLPAEPRKGRVLDGIRNVQNHLVVQGDGRPRLTVDPDCKSVIHEFEMYSWKDGKDEPKKEDDHACFIAGTLVETKRGLIPIETVRAGDYARSRYGWGLVIGAGKTGVQKDVMTLTTKNGTSITGTPDHPIYCRNQDQFVRMDGLKPGDMVAISQGGLDSIAEISTSELLFDVYGIETTHGEYFANGILVSNCDAIRYLLSEEPSQVDVAGAGWGYRL